MDGSLPKLLHLLTKVVRSAPGFSAETPVAPAAAVGAQKSKIREQGPGHPRYVERQAVVDFGVAVSQLAVGSSEAERAHLAPQRIALFLDRPDLPVARGLVPLAVEGPTSEGLSFACRIGLALLLGYADDLGGCNADAQSLGGGEHLVGTLCEVCHYLTGQPAALRNGPVIPAADSHDGAGLEADAVREAEPRIRCRAIVQRKLGCGSGTGRSSRQRFSTARAQASSSCHASSWVLPQEYRTDIRKCHAVGDQDGADDAAHWCVPLCRGAMSVGRVTLCDGCRMRRHWKFVQEEGS